MSNIYPFLMGMAALKHEKIKRFPDVPEPENHLLVAHCGYFGVVPESFSDQWSLKPKVLEIVDDNATAIDARIPEGEITLAKLHPGLDKIVVAEGELENYAQYPGSDCRNGAVIKIKNGHKLMNALYSHHSCIITGHPGDKIDILAKIFDLEIEEA
jgi:L-fucose isomerase-like protein